MGLRLARLMASPWAPAVVFVFLALLPMVEPIVPHPPDAKELAFDLANSKALDITRITAFLLVVQAAVLCTIGVSSVFATSPGKLMPVVPKKTTPVVDLVASEVEATDADEPANVAAEQDEPVSSAPASFMDPAAASFIASSVSASSLLSPDDDVTCASECADREADLSFESTWLVLDGVDDNESGDASFSQLATLHSYPGFHRDWRRVTDLSGLSGGRFRRLCLEQACTSAAVATATIDIPAGTDIASSIWADILLALVGCSSHTSGDALVSSVTAVDLFPQADSVELTIYLSSSLAELGGTNSLRSVLQLDPAWPIRVARV